MDTVRTYLLDDGTRLAIDLAGPRASLPITGSDSWTCLRTGTACAFGFLRHIIGHADMLAADIGETTRWRVHCETNRSCSKQGTRTRCRYQTNVILPHRLSHDPFTGQKHDRVT